MNRHEFLTGLHSAVSPRSYLEIGINDGRSLAASRTRSIGVDPQFAIGHEIGCDLKLVKATSDDFFARPDAIDWFPEGVVDVTLIDGSHIVEFALRDFMNAERLSTPTSVIVVDDVLPRSAAEAARDRSTAVWTGDVYKLAPVLAQHRPDLIVVPLNTTPTGMLLVVGLDPTSTVLADHYDEIVAEIAVPDPQQVPVQVMHRSTAADPAAVLAAPLWAELAAARATGSLPKSAYDLLELRGTSGYVWTEPVRAAAAGTDGRRKPAGEGHAVARPAWRRVAGRVRRAIKRRR